ncbi:uncharacterized protein F4807DRAFT_466960 [Annulohypoxylon truncatum]|uniref:uncharacterized protein n=1 Tax=Annulohypoxylon truncatum TaxID=327061 RepID=UPI002008D646|nr:uncharacterized protein F4807DRAFT_466960 [Annulohypoxylon truncatum]KAI1210579.1 hypothetical protein F4807DRAFT_466960 [Annulohypoxylon truncatum]
MVDEMNNYVSTSAAAVPSTSPNGYGRVAVIQRALMTNNAIPDSAIGLQSGSPLREAMESRINNQPQSGSAIIDMDGVRVSYTFDELAMMGTQLAAARAERRFPRTTASDHDIRAVVEDFGRLAELNEARGTAPPEEWNRMPNVVELHVRIAQEIRARDKTTADLTEEQRVKTLVNNLMEGVGTESRIYGIVQHAVTHAIKKDKGDEAARLAGQNMIEMLKSIRTAINQMADQRTHNVDGVNVEAVLEDVFGMIDHALSENLGERVEQMDGQINRVDGQIMHLNAIGQHVNAIDGHVHSLGNNLNAMGTLLNSTNGNVVSLNTQLGLLQTIVNMLPQMVQQALDEMLPQVLQSALNPIIAVIQARSAALANHSGMSGLQNGHTQKKSIKSFFKGLFKGFRKSGH